ncbi:TetR family transcriptional regulator [Ciceribacter sp. L1K22]|uniref:TetR/AcrR family transcriptional regulator n=1 Tax=Ciceribacter sp. L1K22 TaxID=2820275 RepID=UPI001ABDA3F2|nr:TetR family transcriptional regulator [Ciceribacter sp. L1K22]MBO3758983.1 TetR/AcrR family transcriptional regulator [Ciceribacter sp. L1K22]
MSGGKSGKAGGRLQLRKKPQQERSIQRLEAILAAARELVAEKGVEGLKMTEIAAAAGIPIGSLYQFFPERAAVIRALHDLYTSRVEDGTRRVFSQITTLAAAEEQLSWAIDAAYDSFRGDPIYLPVWLSSMSDRDLQTLNVNHQQRLTQILCDAFRPLLPQGSAIDLETRVMLFVYLSGAAVRRAMIEDDATARRILDEFKASVRKTLFSA